MSVRFVRFVCLALALGIASQAKAPKPSSKSVPRKSVRFLAEASTPPAKIPVGRSLLLTEFVDNDSLRVQGLSDRKSLDWNSGMLFVFPDAKSRTFWMIDCSFDLDIAYMDPHGVVRDIQTMVIEPGVSPELLSRYPSRTDDIMYALEVNRGWLNSCGLKVGDTIPAVVRYKTRR